jgi:hypothetical protein
LGTIGTRHRAEHGAIPKFEGGSSMVHAWWFQFRFCIWFRIGFGFGFSFSFVIWFRIGFGFGFGFGFGLQVLMDFFKFYFYVCGLV